MPYIVLTGAGSADVWDTVVSLIPKLLSLGTTYLNACLENPLYALPIAVPLFSLGAWVVSMFLPMKRRKR